MKIIKGDEVVVIAGKYKGSKGTVSQCFPSKDRVTVSGVNIAKKHKRADAAGAASIIEVERPIHVSNVALLDGNGKASRVAYKTEGNGEKQRVYSTTKEVVA